MTQRTFARFVVFTVALAALSAAYAIDRAHSAELRPTATVHG
jgi:hypothetical protein